MITVRALPLSRHISQLTLFPMINWLGSAGICLIDWHVHKVIWPYWYASQSHSDQQIWLWHFLLSWYASSADLVARWTYLDLNGKDLVPGRLERLVLCVSCQPGVVQFQHGERVGAAAQVGCIESLSPVNLTQTILYSRVQWFSLFFIFLGISTLPSFPWDPRNQKMFFFFIMYSRKVQVKYIADTRLQGRNQEKHMVIWL